MSLTTFFEHDEQKQCVQTFEEKLKQRRTQMLIHSAIYYDLNENIVSDHKWQQWADELEKMQKDNPDKIKIGFFDEAFEDWDGATGAHLPHKDFWVRRKAQQLLEWHKEGILK